MRFGFVTCVQLGLSCMEAIYEVGGALDLAVTLHDEQARRKSGRVYLDEFCAERSIPLLKVRNINDDAAVSALRAADVDWLFIIGWSQIARRAVLDAPRQGVLGMHPTLLPVGRGRAAVPWAILKRLDRTGVTLFKLDEGVDTGDIAAQVEIPLSPNTDAAQLYRDVEAAHVALIKSAFPKLRSGEIQFQPQDESLASVWPGRTPEDGRIDLDGSAADAELLVRATTRPYPGAFFERAGRRTIVWKSELVPSSASASDDLCLQFRDGTLRCLEWEEMACSAEGTD